MMRVAMLTLTLLGVGCASKSDKPIIPPLPPHESPTTPAQSANAPAAPGTVIGHSVQGRAIEMFTFGGGAHPVLVMGAIHGNEPTSEDVTRGLLADLRGNPKLAGGVPVVVIPVANPDGLLAKSRTNVNKVDLNRNFPASNWNTAARRRNNFGGEQAASEPETIALMQTIERLQPRLIISVHSMEKPCNNYDGPAKHIGDLMSRFNGYPSVPTIGYPTPGSLGTWAGIDKKIPMITLELPRSLPASKAWPDNRDAVFAAIGAVK